MRVLLDYRPALRERTGVGEYVHQLARALAQPEAAGGTRGASGADEVVLFSSSWSDRLDCSDAAEVRAARTIDLRWPVRLLNLSWHRLGWPPVELLTGASFDVTHSPHPLLMPSRSAARVVTVHDLYFLAEPSDVRAEIRRDYAVLAARHARIADRVLVPSRYTAGLVQSRLGVPSERISVCPEGVPDWEPGEPMTSPRSLRGHILFLGTLEPRKNVPGLLAAYARLVARLSDAPKLILAGKVPAGADRTLAAIERAPLAGRVEVRGYVPPGQRRALYEGAAMLVLPSRDEGFGLPAVEAMSLGVPVVASNRGALPEVVGGAGLLADPEDPDQLSAAMATILTDTSAAAALAARGRERARAFTWARCAALTREAYELAIATRRNRRSPAAAADGAKR